MSNLVDFLIEIDQLKRTYRFSTLPMETHDSVADHSWRLILMTNIVAEKYGINLNKEKAVRIAMVHDLPEYITGEIDSKLIKMGKVSKEEKNSLEEKAIKDIETRFGEIGKEISNLWHEFEYGTSRESIYVRALDKIEAITHLISIGCENYDNDWEYTATYADEVVNNFPELRPLLKEVKQKLKEECERVGGVWKKEYELI